MRIVDYRSGRKFWLILCALLWSLSACGGGNTSKGNPGGDVAASPDAPTSSPDTTNSSSDATTNPECSPNCLGKQCGDDGCGGTCPSLCTDAQVCVNGVCKAGGCTAQCTGKECGGDGCGGSCGTCGDNMTCSASGQCTSAPVNPVTGNCPPNGTGYNVGDQIKNISWTESTGNTLELHSFCGVANAIVIVESAGW